MAFWRGNTNELRNSSKLSHTAANPRANSPSRLAQCVHVPAVLRLTFTRSCQRLQSSLCALPILLAALLVSPRSAALPRLAAGNTFLLAVLRQRWQRDVAADQRQSPAERRPCAAAAPSPAQLRPAAPCRFCCQKQELLSTEPAVSNCITGIPTQPLSCLGEQFPAPSHRAEIYQQITG